MDNGYDTPAAIHGVNAFQDNYIWLIRKGKRVVVVDPGDAQPVLEALDAHGLQLEAILLTHHHGDHVGGVMTLLERAAVPVYGPANERLPHCDFALGEGDSVALPAVDLALRVVDVPGHTAGHIAYHGTVGGEPVLFCGDTLFASGCGRLFEGTAEQMHESLGKFSDLPGHTRVYCAHEYTLSNNRFALAVEPDNSALQEWAQRAIALRDAGKATVPTLLSHERAVNPFLRTAEPAVVAAVCQYAGRSPEGGAGVFGALRAWKDEFR